MKKAFNLTEIIENKIIEIEVKRKNKKNSILEIVIPEIGCNVKCHYCFQHQTSVYNINYNAAEIIKKYFVFFLNMLKKINVNIDEISILGGELKVLSLENQLKLIELINELKKKYDITLLVNDTKLDSPLMRIEGITYYIHVLNWKNKNLLELDKKLNEIDSVFYYNIVVTDNDTKEEIDNFLEINNSIKQYIVFGMDNTSNKYVNFIKLKKGYLDNKHCIYECSRYGKKTYNFEIYNNQILIKKCCLKEPTFFSINENLKMESFLKKEIKKCSNCNIQFNEDYFEYCLK